MSDNLYRIVPGSNPFAVHTPEDIPPDEVVDLFVNSMAELPGVTTAGHIMMHGPRGSGKSMIFRYLMPECQMIATGHSFSKLPFIGLYVGVKRSELGLTELRRLSAPSPDYYFLEHMMVMHVLYKLSEVLRKHASTDLVAANSLATFISQRLLRAGLDTGVNGNTLDSPTQLYQWFHGVTGILKDQANAFIRRIHEPNAARYEGPLCGYAEFFLPLIDELKAQGALPNCPVYLLVDDADVLGHAQTQILNSWIYMRTSMRVSIKATTQYRYKTFRTPAGSSIEVPHDYSELDTGQIYTRRSGRYHGLVTDIIKNRFKKADISSTVQEFFPNDPEQESKIDEIRNEYLTGVRKGGASRPQDNADRYARPDYIRDNLKGPSASGAGSVKKGSNYNYGGYDQLIHVSDGVYRFFLGPAKEMYDAQVEKNGGVDVKQIEPRIQNEKIREEASLLRFKEFDRLSLDEKGEIGGVDKVKRLQNLVKALGEVFHTILISRRSERKVFSIALSNQPDDIIYETLAFGVASGYFSESTIGNKDGTGRTRLYVLTRRLAPAFLLDPTGFAGYLFVTNDFLHQAMTDPDRARRSFERRLGSDVGDHQLLLFEEGDLS